jgi:hypothetical protein
VSNGSASKPTAVDPDTCYWAVLTGDIAQKSPEARLYAAEAFFPVPLEECVTAQVTIHPKTVLVCATEKELLPASTQQWWWGPHAFPNWIIDQVPELTTNDDHRHWLSQCNLLPSSKQPQQHLPWFMVGIVAFALLIASIWWWRWHAAQQTLWRNAAQALQAHSQQLLVERMPANATGRNPWAWWRGEQRRIQTNGASGGAIDTTNIVEALWSNWPRTVRMQTTAVTINEQQIILRGTVADLSAAEQVQQSLREWQPPASEGHTWQWRSPTVQRGNDVVHVVLTAQRLPSGGKP